MSLPDFLTVTPGQAPLIVSVPHAGTAIPPNLQDRFVAAAQAQWDADWHVERLYGFAAALDATVIRTALSRSVIDVNRDPSGRSLYPGQATTGLCPVETFDGAPLYRDGEAPDEAEIAGRRTAYFDPYHALLDQEIARLRARRRRVVLLDAHSIRSVVPRLFEGVLPHVNIGTNSGASCAPELPAMLEALCRANHSHPAPLPRAEEGGSHSLARLQEGVASASEAGEGSWTHVTNGRFKGGWITRHYGQPSTGVHTIQIELAMRAYLDEPPPERWPPVWNDDRAAPMAALLRTYLARLIDWASAEDAP